MGPLTTAWLSLFAFYLVVVIEMFVPSAGILFIVSALLALGAIVFGFFHSVWAGAMMIAIVVFSMPVLFAAFAYIWPHTPLGKRFIMKAPQADSVLPQSLLSNPLHQLKGAKAKVLSLMLPSGTIEIDGKQYTATCNSGSAEPGQWMRVIEVKMNRLIVMPVEIADDHQAEGGFEDELEKAVEQTFEDFEWDDNAETDKKNGEKNESVDGNGERA